MSTTWGKLLAYNSSLLISIVVTVCLGNSLADLPAIGPLLSPFTGFWRNTPEKFESTEIFKWKSLSDEVKVVWDEHRIPHIFAQQLTDMYMAQGFIHARDRLFEMDLSSRPASGSLAEFVGEELLPYDRFFVSIGMRDAVQAAYDEAMADPEVRAALEAYSEGVNRYILSLWPSEYPVEYKLIGQKPGLWTPRRSVEFLKMMTFRLAGRSYDLMVTKHLQKLGLEKTLSLFPAKMGAHWFAGFETGKGYQSVDLPRPKDFTTSLTMFPEYLQPFATNGSNNWAISAKVSGDEHTYLANDTHLRYSSPSIWYEQQLVSKKEGVNIYGAALPGGIGIQVGFNKNFGWAVTNGTTDVADWYEVEFTSETGDEYLWDGETLKAEPVKEVIRLKDGGEVIYNSLRTKAGIVLNREGKLGLALQWLPSQPSEDVRAFLDLTRASSLEECRKAIQNLMSPSQNVICADNQDVSIFHAGKVPIRPFGDGQFVKDGRGPQSQWKGFVPFESIPKSEKPKSGVVYSANAAVSSEKYPYFVSWDFAPPFRAMQIGLAIDKLLSEGRVSMQTMQELQNNNFDVEASMLLPLMLQGMAMSELPESFAGLKEWDFVASADSALISMFKAWRGQLLRELFEPTLGKPQGNLYPKPELVIDLLGAVLSGKAHPADWILGETPKSRLREVLGVSAQSAEKSLKLKWGEDSSQWIWGNVQATRLDHVLKIDAFGKVITNTGGSISAINANAGVHGASWRQVVKLGAKFEAVTNYPGGQSGNPFDPSYHQYVDDWAQGVYRQVNFYTDSERL